MRTQRQWWKWEGWSDASEELKNSHGPHPDTDQWAESGLSRADRLSCIWAGGFDLSWSQLVNIWRQDYSNIWTRSERLQDFFDMILWWGRESWQNRFKGSVGEYKSNFICSLPIAVHLINQVPFLTADAGDSAEGTVGTKSEHKQVPAGVARFLSLKRSIASCTVWNKAMCVNWVHRGRGLSHSAFEAKPGFANKALSLSWASMSCRQLLGLWLKHDSLESALERKGWSSKKSMLQMCEKKGWHEERVYRWESTACTRKLKQHSIPMKEKGC